MFAVLLVIAKLRLPALSVNVAETLTARPPPVVPLKV
jgi:hypothetical protein